jgi:integrase
MGTITMRSRDDGSQGYRAQIRIKVKGKIVHQESQTFERRQAANAWMARRETELREPGALGRIGSADNDPPLSEAIDRYVKESERAIGRTKAQVLRSIKKYAIADMRCSKITSADIVQFVKSIPTSPATRQNYLSHLGAIFAIARPAWGYPLDQQAIKDAFVVAKRLGTIRKGGERDRRPTIDELNKLMDHFVNVESRRNGVMPMTKIIPFAIFSARRQEEITLIRWDDYEKAHGDQPARILIRDMKHPGDKIGNDVWCDLPTEAVAFIDSMSKVDERIFPYSTDAISAAFTRACYVTGINAKDMPDEERLHFHDLRHEGVSRLFEMGKQIPQAASVSGHRSWQNLKRYTHLRQIGDKYANWKWRLPATG